MYQIYANGNLIYQPGNDRLRLTSPKLTVEMGKAGALQFGIPPTHPYYGNLQQLKAILTVSEGDDELFRGRVLSNKRNFNNIREIYGEGNLSYLVDSVQKPKKYKGKTDRLFREIIDAHNGSMDDRVNPGTNPENKLKQFVVGHIDEELIRDAYIPGKNEDTSALDSNRFDYNQIVIDSEVDEWQTTFDFLESGLLDTAGGYLRTRYVPEEDKTYIDWYKDHYSETNQSIAFGKNMLDLTEENNAEDAFSILIPIGDENLTIEKITDVIVPGYVREDESGNSYYYIVKYGNELVYRDAVEKYGRIVKTKVFDGVTKASTLLENGARYLKEHGIPPATITITAVDLHVLNPGVQPIHVGDKVHVISAPHNVDDSDLVCTKIEYDLTNPANTVYTFGKPKQDLTERYRKDKKKDVSGRDGGGGAAKKAEENAGSALAESYREWITYDPNDKEAKIDIATLFERTHPDKSKITSGTQILMYSDDGTSKIDLISKFNSAIDNISNQAGIDVVSGADGASVVIYAQNNGRRAEINIGGTDVLIGRDPITGEEKYITKSSLAFKADVSKLETETLEIIASESFSLSTRIATLETDYLEIDTKILKVIADNLNITAEGGGISVPVLKGTNSIIRGDVEISGHSHYISCDGAGLVTIGTVSEWSLGAQSSFNMADTQYFKNAMSAEREKWEPTSISNSTSIQTTYYNGEKYESYLVEVTAKNKDGKALIGKSINTGNKAYTDGKKDGRDSVTVKQSDTYVTYHSSNGVRVHIGLSNGKGGTYNLAFND